VRYKLCVNDLLDELVLSLVMLSDDELLNYDQSNTDVWTTSVFESYWLSAVDI
jgi:hypothetical protein